MEVAWERPTWALNPSSTGRTLMAPRMVVIRRISVRLRTLPRNDLYATTMGHDLCPVIQTAIRPLQANQLQIAPIGPWRFP
ncbi:MAG: hypothetical protein KVP17_003497 [Porospora cf. gigantea B]|uniref:uncharacterized protein n=1 Tax=Porospora cf. gigantea B TaxID=2853592 RepID=UPI003571B92F|nr:MAG: hypothetical protein KVP17_003497 [Porospora cf. gigantea B]